VSKFYVHLVYVHLVYVHLVYVHLVYVHLVYVHLVYVHLVTVHGTLLHCSPYAVVTTLEILVHATLSVGDLHRTWGDIIGLLHVQILRQHWISMRCQGPTSHVA